MHALVKFAGAGAIAASVVVFGLDTCERAAAQDAPTAGARSDAYRGYQRRRAPHGTDYSVAPGGGSWSHMPDRRDDRWRHHRKHHYRKPEFRQRESQTSQSGWFQRPYPYHLDYYKMRFGGSYAPYFGNIYGPPNVVIAPPFGYGAPYGGSFFNGPPIAAPQGVAPPVDGPGF